MKYVAVGGTIYFKFPSQTLAGAKATLSGSPVISAYKNGSTTQSTAGITLTVDYDSVTGLNHVAIDTSADGTFYADGSIIQLVITAGTVDSISVVGEVVGEFTMGPIRAVDNSGNAIATSAALTTIANAIGSFTGTGVNTILGFLRAIMRSDASVPSDVGGTFASSTDSLEALGTAVAGLSSSLGSGADLCTQRIRETDLTPVADADVWITTDSAGTNVVAGTRQTDSSGEVTFLLDAGNSYYLWAQKDGWEGIQGTAFTAVAD